MRFLRSRPSRHVWLLIAALAFSISMFTPPAAAQSALGAALGAPQDMPTTSSAGSGSDNTVDPRALTGTQPISSPQLPAPIVNSPLTGALRAAAMASAAAAAAQQRAAAPQRPNEFQRFVQTARSQEACRSLHSDERERWRSCGDRWRK